MQGLSLSRLRQMLQGSEKLINPQLLVSPEISVFNHGEANTFNYGSIGSYVLPEDSGSIAAMDPDIFMEAMDVAMAVIDKADKSKTQIVHHELKTSPYPVISMKGNEWMVKAFRDTARASLDEIISVFDGGDLEPMRSFWLQNTQLRLDTVEEGCSI